MTQLTPTGSRFDGQNHSDFEQQVSGERSFNQIFKEYYSSEAQMSHIQIEAVSAAIRSRAPGCNMLVFGLGNDSPLWSNLNQGGYTLFIENSLQWISHMKGRHPTLNVEHMEYQTTVEGSMKDPAALVRQATLPKFIEDRIWDVILVDGPMGYAPSLPGRALPLVWTSLVATSETHIFVDDYERHLEKSFADFLFSTRLANQSVVLQRPEKPRLNASSMLWLFGISDALTAASG